MSENGHSASDGSSPNERVNEKGEIKFSYGGQAVIEGVMIRGRRTVALACRKPNGEIYRIDIVGQAPKVTGVYGIRNVVSPTSGMLLPCAPATMASAFILEVLP